MVMNRLVYCREQNSGRDSERHHFCGGWSIVGSQQVKKLQQLNPQLKKELDHSVLIFV